MNILRNSLIALAAVALIFGVISIIVDQDWGRGFTLNLATEAIGILLTVLLIDGVLRRREERERKRY